ncbi:polymer-forming cytoskeletal protein [Exiguobacterium algae]|uniref:polymer-forming cytoskeletal protein n=1 Tax=Exiguobacterium algae TaxID=2751250 RepID=UPI001BEB2DD0|nr:polymer-forming cytoskeletal protein [Exiguobacterium algae]
MTPEEKLQQYLEDGVLPEESEELRQLLEDEKLYRAYLQYERIDAELKALPRPKLSADFTSRVMASLPDQQTVKNVEPISNAHTRRGKITPPRSRQMVWLQKHPALIAAVLFFSLMSSATLGLWNSSTETMTYTKAPGIIVTDNEVVVPAGVTVDRDLTVQGGNLRVEGTVKGNATAVHGRAYLASAGEVTGDLEQIDQIFEWVWYSIKQLF